MKNTTYGPGGFDPSKPNNNIIEEVEVFDEGLPLDSVGALATLLAVVGVLDVDDAANAVGLAPGDLIREAQAWALAAVSQQTPPNGGL